MFNLAGGLSGASQPHVFKYFITNIFQGKIPEKKTRRRRRSSFLCGVTETSSLEPNGVAMERKATKLCFHINIIILVFISEVTAKSTIRFS